MKRLFMTLVLTCALCCAASAGDIPSVNAPVPPPPGQSSSGTSVLGEIPSVPGDIPTLGVAEQLSDEALTALLQSLGLLSF